MRRLFGKVLHGNGNVRGGEFEGYVEENVIATYLHGPLLSKNPKLADHIISYCMKRKGESAELAPLNDKLEEACRKQLLKRLSENK